MRRFGGNSQCFLVGFPGVLGFLAERGAKAAPDSILRVVAAVRRRPLWRSLFEGDRPTVDDHHFRQSESTSAFGAAPQPGSDRADDLERQRETDMSKGERHGNRETKKPKKEKIKVIAAAPSQKGGQPTFTPGKKK
ncbi:hypothetical protein ACE103_38085 [Bradyrhizobium sp. ma5]|uniref:hypothetical protein n=1 Tax=Bradyrhizobium sp. ma5 TaxID=3344828 RepID=UPI0035D407B0